MELTIGEVLQQGITAHKEGKIQEAERLYRAIIQSQPAHPDANHNLGILKVSLNKAELALPLFETALEANPKIEQFWLSYIDALIKEKQFETAKQIIQQAKTHGVAEEKLNVLEIQLTPTVQVKTNNPSQQQISSLVEHYQNGRFNDAEKLAVSITQEFPTHQFGWKVLGAVLAQTGRKSEAVDANQKAIALSPQDTEAHNNLGITLQELGRLDEAEANFRQAITLKLDYVEAHNNLGTILQELGRLDEAEASYKQAIAFKPDYAEAHSNLGITLQELGRLNEAEASFRQAIALKLDYVEAHNNLGTILQELGRLDEAEASYKQAIAFKPDYAEAHNNLGNTLKKLRRLDEAENSYKQAITFKPDYAEAHYNLGITLQELGRLDESEVSCTQAIALKPDFVDAHYNLGVTLKELGRLDEAVASYNQAIALKPDYVEVYSNLGATLQELGRLDEAEASYTQAIALKPDFAEDHYNLGVTLKELGRLDEAEASYKQAIALKPDFAGARNNLGTILQKLGRLDEAEASYIQAIALKPDYAEAHNNLGTILQELGRFDEAEASYTQAIALKSDYAEAYSNLGFTLQKLKRLDEAEASCTQAIALKPDYAEAHSNLGNTLQELGRFDEAEANYTQTIALKPDYAEAYSNLGTMLQELGRLDEAEASYKQAIALKLDFAEAYSNLGGMLQELGRLDEAQASCRQAIALKPDYARAHSNLGFTLQELGRFDEALASYNQAIEIKIDISEAYNDKYFCLNYFPSVSPLSIFEQHLEFEKQFGGLQIEPILNPKSNLRVERRLRVGYVSGDFKKHPVAYFFEPLLQHHNSNAVETFCYYNNFPIDEITKRLMTASDHWRPIVGIADSDVANLIRNDKIDILVDLSGHTSKNRLLVFAKKPAPIQVTWLGYPNTTGLSAIDYRFTDIIADPIGKADELHSESLVRLANGFQCYKGNKEAHSNSELPFKRQGYITFGSFNNLTKVTPEVIRVWSHILHAVPKSLLVLKAKQLQHNANHYRDCFKKEGITEDRITLLETMPSTHDHLELYNTIDICLDPFPFNGATTTCEALWMGVPVITLSGDRHVGRVGASILTNVGLTDFIAQDIDGYIQLAVEKASNTNYLKDIRKGLRERMLEAPLCDGRSFANDVESAYREMQRCYQE